MATLIIYIYRWNCWELLRILFSLICLQPVDNEPRDREVESHQC